MFELLDVLFSDTSGVEWLPTAMGILLLFVFILLVIMGVLYILGSLGTMRIAARQGDQLSWLAWVPIANMYLLGKVGMSMEVGAILTGGHLLNQIMKRMDLGLNSLANTIGFAVLILQFVALHKIYQKLSKKAVVMTIFTVLTLGILGPIFLFAIRNNDFLEDGETAKTDQIEDVDYSVE